MIDVAGAVLVGVKVTCTNLAKGVSKVVCRDCGSSSPEFANAGREVSETVEV
jgi:hypothetical protein